MTTDATRNNAEQWHIPPRGPQLGEGMAPVEAVKQPVMAMSVIDLKPLISFFANELQRERDRVAVERTTASSAREALAACEERLRAAHVYAGKLDEARLAAVGEANRFAVERDNAVVQLEQAKTVPPGMVPGSVAAVLEAYRLIAGHDPQWDNQIRWNDQLETEAGSITKACGCLIAWLDKNAPGGVK